MASARPTKNGKTWEAVWNIDKRQRTKAPFPGKRAAVKYAEDQEAAHRRGAYIENRDRRLTFQHPLCDRATGSCTPNAHQPRFPAPRDDSQPP